MNNETFSDFLMGEEPLPEDGETMNFDSFPWIDGEGFSSVLEAHPYGEILMKESKSMREEKATGFYRELSGGTDNESDDGNLTDDEIAEAEAIDVEFPDGEAYDYLDPLPSDNSQPGTKGSIDKHAEVQRLIEETENKLEQLSMQAQVHIERQPLSTQILLANLANEQVFKPYAQHGSQAQFSASVMKFLSGGDTIRRPGKEGLKKSKDGILRLAPVSPFAEGDSDIDAKEKREKLKRKMHDESPRGSKVSGDSERVKLKVVKRGDKLVSVMKSPLDEPSITQTVPDSHQCNKADEYAMPFDDNDDVLTPRKTSGPIKWEDLQAAQSALGVDSSWSEEGDQNPAEALANFDGASSLKLSPTRAVSRQQPITLTPLANSFSNFQLQTPTSQLFSTNPFAQPMPLIGPPLPTYSCSVEPRANSELALQPYNPIRLDLIWPAGQSAPSPEYIQRINHVLNVYNKEAKIMLSYFVRKYDTPFELGGGGPGGGGALRMGGQAKNEPPHALFRLGIAQYLMCKAESTIEDKETDDLGLTPETRSILRSVWNEHPSMWTHFEDNFLEDAASDDEDEDMITGDEDEDGDSIWVTDTPDGASIRPVRKRHVLEKPDPKHVMGGLNPLEKTLLARACNISVETIEAYWDVMRDKTKAWAAVQLWCRARNMEKIARAKAEGRW